jgi:predicted nucleotidyltransferase
MDVASLEAVIDAMNRAGVVYVVAGGVAVIAHGYARTTTDLDLIIALDSENCLLAMKALEALGYRPRAPVRPADFANAESRRSWIEEKGMIVFQLISDRLPQCPIDIFVREPFDVKMEAAHAADFEISTGIKAPVLRLERLLELKAAAARATDLDDIAKLERIRELRGRR